MGLRWARCGLSYYKLILKEISIIFLQKVLPKYGWRACRLWRVPPFRWGLSREWKTKEMMKAHRGEILERGAWSPRVWLLCCTHNAKIWLAIWRSDNFPNRLWKETYLPKIFDCWSFSYFSSPFRAISKAPSTSICFHFENKMFIESFSQLCLFWHSVFWIRLA